MKPKLKTLRQWKRRFEQFMGMLSWMAAVLAIVIVVGTFWIAYSAPYPNGTHEHDPDPWTKFARIAKIVELGLLAVGSLSLILLSHQIWQSRLWNKHLSYHQFFGEFPKREKVQALREALHRLGLPQPNQAMPLDKEKVNLILNDTGLDREGGIIARYARELHDCFDKARLPLPAPAPSEFVDFIKGASSREYRQNAKDALFDFLNDFEEFALAVNTGVVDKQYACLIEGARVINVFFGFQAVIAKARLASESIDSEKSSELLEDRKPFSKRLYVELEGLARTWLRERQQELAEEQLTKPGAGTRL